MWNFGRGEGKSLPGSILPARVRGGERAANVWQPWRSGASFVNTPPASWIWLALVIVACVPAVLPFVKPGYFWNANDARHDAYFIFEYTRALRDGNLYPRWLPDMTFGYGYPLFNIYAPLAVQVGVLLHLLGLGVTQAVETVFALSLILSALAMYAFLRHVLGEGAASVAAVAYAYAPYHLFDMYQRAAMAESFAFVWMPLVLWGVRASVQRPSPRSIAGLGLAYAGLMLTSNLVAVTFTPLVAGYGLVLALIEWRERSDLGWGVRGILAAAIGGGLGLALSAWFWLPALLEFKYVNQSQWYGGYYDFRQHFVYFFQLFSPHWGFGISIPGPDDVISFQIGIVPYLLAVAGLIALFQARTSTRLEGAYFALVAVFATFLTTEASLWLWDHVPGVAFAQFPWRYLMLTTVAVSVMVGWGIHRGTPRSTLLPVSLIVAAVLIWGSSPYLYVEVVEPLPEQGPVGLPALMRFQASEDEMTGVTVFAKEIPRWSGLAEIMARGQDVRTRVEFGHVERDPALEVRSLEYHSSWERVWFRAKTPGRRIVFNVQMYPGWTAYIYDATGTQLQQVLRWDELDVTDPYGLVTVPVPEGEHILILRFEDTLPRKVGKGVSVLGILTLLGLLGWEVRSAAARGPANSGNETPHLP